MNIYKTQKQRHLILPLVLVLLLIFAGCTRRQTENTPDSQIPADETKRIVEDDQLYILLNHNPETGKIFMECVDTDRQENFEYDKDTCIYGKTGETLCADQLQTGELLRIVYTEENLLKEIRISEDTFLKEGITDFSIDVEQETFTAEGSCYSYNENLKIFMESELVAVNELSEAESICIRGKEDQVLTLVIEACREPDETED